MGPGDAIELVALADLETGVLDDVVDVGRLSDAIALFDGR